MLASRFSDFSVTELIRPVDAENLTWDTQVRGAGGGGGWKTSFSKN